MNARAHVIPPPPPKLALLFTSSCRRRLRTPLRGTARIYCQQIAGVFFVSLPSAWWLSLTCLHPITGDVPGDDADLQGTVVWDSLWEWASSPYPSGHWLRGLHARISLHSPPRSKLPKYLGAPHPGAILSLYGGSNGSQGQSAVGRTCWMIHYDPCAITPCSNLLETD